MENPVVTFFNAWSETDASARLALIAASTVTEVVYDDPRTPDTISGQSALSDYVGQFSANAPGWTATVVNSSQTAGVTRATIAFGGQGPDGQDMIQHGQYFIEFADDRISRMIGFVGLGQPE